MIERLKGFTMIELLVVMTIIGLLVLVVIPNITTIKTRSRDEKRVSELGVIETALNQYRQACGTYPFSDSSGKINVNANNGVPGTNVCPGGVTLAQFLPSGFTPTSWADIEYYPLFRGTQGNYTRCTSYKLAVALSSNQAAPIKRLANRGWTWASSASTFSWRWCDSVPKGVNAIPTLADNYYDVISPSPY